MKRNQLLLLAAAAAVALVLIWVGRDTDPISATLDSGPLYPELEASVNRIDRVVINGPEAAEVRLSRDGDTWQVEPPGGYPADVSRLRELLLELAQARRIEAKTSKPEHYARLGLQGLEAADSPSRRLRLAQAGEVTHDLWIGDRRQGESFVRREGEAQTWLVSGRLEASANPIDWVSRDIIDIARSRVRSVAVGASQTEGYRIERPTPDAEFTMPGKPQTAVLKRSAIERLAGALAGLELTDVSALDEAAAAAGRTLRFETFDGLAVEAQLSKRDERFFLQLQVGLAEPSAGATDADGAAESPQAEANALQAAVEPWLFELSDYSGGSLALLKADLLENQAAE